MAQPQQPNLQRLSDGLTMIAQEVVHASNLLPNFQGEIMEQFRILNARFDGLELYMSAESQNQVARVFNSHLTSPEIPFQPLHNRQNQVVDGFPLNLAALARLNDASTTRLLNAYGLGSDGTVAIKKRRFKYFIGVVMEVIRE
ncbi:MAG: hypothetical protein M1830_004409 [Pleopsidium flavum]|nr:MAG: hypothetical protein M1830_004409 [Pleopsidium flavum]